MEIFFQNLSKLIHMHSTNAIRIIEFYGNRVFEWEYMNWDEKGFEIISFKWLLFLTNSELSIIEVDFLGNIGSGLLAWYNSN